MTDFILEDGTVLDRNQEWGFHLHTGDFIGVLRTLHPRTEKMVFSLTINPIASITVGHEVSYEIVNRFGDRDWVVHWDSFKIWYRLGNVWRYDAGKPVKRLRPHIFR
jgi:hypothetical protein